MEELEAGCRFEHAAVLNEQQVPASWLCGMV